METTIYTLLTIVDALTSPTAKDYYAGALTIVMGVLIAELIAGMF